MPTYEEVLRNALATVSPLVERGKRGGLRWNLSRHSLGASMEVIFRIAPHVSDATYLSLFNNLLDMVKTAEGREFAEQFLVFLKRTSSDPAYSRFARKLIKQIALHQNAATEKRSAWVQEHGFSLPSFLVMSPTWPVT